MEPVAMLATLGFCVLNLILSLEHGAHAARVMSASVGASVQGEVSPCKFHWQVPGWDCPDAPQRPLPPCNFKLHSPGIDCWSISPLDQADVTDVSHTAKSAVGLSGVTQSGHAVEQWPELPPCDFPGAMPGWDCFDPPQKPLPPCDFKHRRPGIDCWPPAAKETEISAAGCASESSASLPLDQKNTSQSDNHGGGMLPSCMDVQGGILGWDCYDPPPKPLPPCDFKHHSPGIDCWTRHPPASL